MIVGEKKGFTLLEVILAVSILATLSVLSTQAISRALKSRNKIQAEVDDVSALRDSMRLIKADINMAFHHIDFEKEMSDIVYRPSAPQTLIPGQIPPASTNAPQRKTKRQDPTTNFNGSETELNFATMNGARITSSVKQADFIEVGYSLKNCKSLTEQKTSQCLYRRVENILDDDIKSGGNEMVLLENVSEFKLRYIGEGKQDWVNQWNSSNNSPDGGTRGKFPESVEVNLAIEREFEGKPRSYSLQFVIPIHFPNNVSSEKSSSLPATPTTGGTGGP